MTKKTTKRKISKRKISKSKPRTKHELVVTVRQAPVMPTEQDLINPQQTTGGKYMIPKTWMSEKQVVHLVQKTPAQFTYTRPAKGGGTWTYVTGAYVEKVLNFIFGWNWDFEIVSHGHEGDLVWVLGKLTVKDDHGHVITKSQFGRAEVKKLRSGGNLDYGNDLKAAATDALKKCASMLGIASDIYGKTEYKVETGNEVREAHPMQAISAGKINPPIKPEQIVPEKPQTLKPGQIKGPDGKPCFVCEKCAVIVTDQIAEYSKRVFGHVLCREDQSGAKRK